MLEAPVGGRQSERRYRVHSTENEDPARDARHEVMELLTATNQFPSRPRGTRLAVVGIHDDAQGVEVLPLTDGMTDQQLYALLLGGAESVVRQLME